MIATLKANMRPFRCWYLLACSLLAAQAACAQPYYFSTLAGTAWEYGWTDGTGSEARFSCPEKLALDSAGNIYVADSCMIRKVTPAGVVTAIAGLAYSVGTNDGVGSDARFAGPTGVAVDSEANIYVGDSENNTIRKITPGGMVSTFAGQARISGHEDGWGSDARFSDPEGVAVDNAGNLYVADVLNCTIRKITSDGIVSTLAGLAGSYGYEDGRGSDARFTFPRGVAVGGAGNVYVADTGNLIVRKITPDGVVSTLGGLGGGNARFDFPYGVAVDNAGNVFVADTYNDTIQKITPAGVVSNVGGVGGDVLATNDGLGSDVRFYYPHGVAVDAAGKLYVADSLHFTIRVGALIRPSLALDPRTGRIILSWPTIVSNLVLEASSTLAPGAVWTPQTNGVVTVGDRFVLTNTPDAPAQFYRLRAP